MSDYNFKLFTGIKGKYTPVVSFSKPGILSFSSGAQHRYELSQYKAAQLLFDAEKRVIAVKFLPEEGENAFNLRHREDKKGSFIACKSFISAHGLDPYYGKRFTPVEMEYPDLGKILIIDLNNQN